MSPPYVIVVEYNTDVASFYDCSESEQRIGKRYRLIRKLGEGSFGKVFLGTDVTSGESVAIKIEDTEITHPYLHEEEKVYRILEGGEGFPTVRWSGKDGSYNFLVTDLLGPSLYDYYHLCKKHFTLKTILLIADQLIRRLEYIHSAGFIHRDVKPENFLVGHGNKSDVIYSIDFGLSKLYRNQNNEHVPYKNKTRFAGTTRYASINTLLGIQQSRRDDMESFGYVLMYFLLRKLPWQKLNIKNKHKKRKKVLQLKQSSRIDDMIKGYPQEFAIYLKRCRSLRFEEKPDYYNLRLLFRNLLHRQNLTSDNTFDWQDANGRCKNTIV
ncbi:Casein kinase I isoform delta [Mizuhopecten yessoensis]|uniref:non-specific serine/threonine protein kinase n=1 Tax=Mizuhopecten yessoensis TaxID=6573 RepID=A0A210PE97_MIZYE|nr:Casein kinase I isoform delta [Mizuhopecten yessoensis]